MPHASMWLGVPWTSGIVPWLVMVPGSVVDWRYETRPFRAKTFWLSRLITALEILR